MPWGGGLNAYSVEQLSVIEPVARSMPGYLQEMTPEITSIMAQVRWKLNRIEPSLNRQPFFLIKSKKALARLGFYVFLFGVSPKGLNNQKKVFLLCNTHVFDVFLKWWHSETICGGTVALLLTLTAEKWIKGKRLVRQFLWKIKGMRDSSGVWIVSNQLFSPLIAFGMSFVQWIVCNFATFWPRVNLKTPSSGVRWS